MSVIATIDCGYLATVQAMAAEKWTNPIQQIDFIAQADAAKAVLENQRVRFEELQSKTKKKVVSVEWQTTCGAALEDCTDDCTIGGEDVSPVCKEYEISCLKEYPFKIYDRVYREKTIDTQEATAVQMLTGMKLLDEWIASYILTGILTNSALSRNVFTGSPGTVVLGTTTIPAALWNDNIWAYLELVKIYNQFTNPYLVSGTNLFSMVYNRLAEQANADGKGNVAKMGGLRDRIYFDPVNVETIAPHHTFMLHQTAVAFINKAWYPLGAANAVTLTADRKAFSLNSYNLPGIVYDVFTERGCHGNDYYTATKLQLHGVFAVNPTPCSETNNGILALECA